MPTPPVHHPRDVDYERRVRVGLALVAVGMVLPFLLDWNTAIDRGSLFCVPFCRSPLPFVAYLVAVPPVVGVTLWWWTRPDAGGPREVASAELVALFGLVGWWYVLPIHPGLVVVLVGGVVTALGTGGLVEDRDATVSSSRLAATGGVVIWTGFLAVGLLGYWPVALALLYLPLLAVYLVLCASPLSWRRLHALFFVGAMVVGFRLWRAVGRWRPASPDDIATGSVPPVGVSTFGGEVLLVCSVMGATMILCATLGEIALRTVPSLTDQMGSGTTEA